MKLTNQSSYSCVILDDDQASIEMLRHQLSYIAKMEIAGQFTDPVKATEAFNSFLMIDFLFLDINMEISGIDVARMLRNKVKHIVFVTGYSEFALEAFAHGDAYLVKPVDLDTLKRAIKHLLQKREKSLHQTQSNL